ncbi:hypothetical protein [Streptomyces kurssanovii]|uniref:Integral membrane protein n=1 Tax=Streptomyces kurssanovii TaxID=67312 RepID=A0ABV3HN27_9ACTN
MKVAGNARSLRLATFALSLAGATLMVCGFLIEAGWLVGIGGWMMIAAVLIAFLYRP